jgi:multidrug efflux system outer membrane protein
MVETAHCAHRERVLQELLYRFHDTRIILPVCAEGNAQVKYNLRSGMRIERFSWIVLGLAVAGCSVGPDYQRPPTEAPKSWRGQAAAQSWPSEDWWRGFQASELDRLMRAAREANFDLAVAVARLREANAQALITGAQLLPSVSANGGAERIRELPSYKSGTKSFTAGLTASYELDFWGQLADQAEAASMAARASAFNRQTAELTVQSSVAGSYFALLSLNERVALAEDNIRAAEGVLDAYMARFEVGTASELDLAQQQNVVDEQRAALPPLLEQQRQTHDALALLVGSLPEQLSPPQGTLDQVRLPQVVSGLPSALLARRPDVQSAEAQLQAANANVKAAIASLFPTISLTAQGGGVSSALSGLFKPAGAFYVLTGGLTQPLFKGGALEGGIELARGQYDEQTALYRKAVVSAFADVEDALAAVEMETRRETAQTAVVTSARKAYDIAQAQLYSGTVDILTVLNTQRSLFQAQDLLAQARLGHAQAVVGLFKALGGGWQGTEEG